MTGPDANSGSCQSRASVKTPHASRYLQQLCKHFAHKVEATFGENEGRVFFSIGECAMRADGNDLHLAVIANGPQTLPDMKDVIERHLVRFAFREALEIPWDDGPD